MCIMEDFLWDWVEFVTYPSVIWSTIGLAILSPWVEAAEWAQQIEPRRIRYTIEERWEGFLKGVEIILYDPLKVIGSFAIMLYDGVILVTLGLGFSLWTIWEESLYAWEGFFWTLDLAYQISNAFILHFDHVADYFVTKKESTIPFLIFWPLYFVFYYPFLLMDTWWQTDIMYHRTSLNMIVNYAESINGTYRYGMGYMPTLTEDKKPLTTGLNRADEGKFFSKIVGDEDLRNSENLAPLSQYKNTDYYNQLLLYKTMQTPLVGRTGFDCSVGEDGKRPLCAKGYCCGSNVN